MSLKSAMLAAVVKDPMAVRAMFADAEVALALASVGIGKKDGFEIFELHLPSVDARTSAGLGRTLCSRTGIRHPVVTCKACLKKQDGISKP